MPLCHFAKRFGSRPRRAQEARASLLGSPRRAHKQGSQQAMDEVVITTSHPSKPHPELVPHARAMLLATRMQVALAQVDFIPTAHKVDLD
eukprot:2234518-Alexandrium_andersonii.AAC.1